MSESYTEHEEELARMLGLAEYEREQVSDELEDTTGVAAFLLLVTLFETVMLAVLGASLWVEVRRRKARR